MPTHKITQILRTKTKKGDPMWKMFTWDGEMCSLFVNGYNKKYTDMFIYAGYMAHLNKLVDGQTMECKNNPIPVDLEKNGQWWQFRSVYPLADWEPDPEVTPDLSLLRRRAINTCKALLKERHLVVYFDCETTGTGTDDEIVALTAVDNNSVAYFSRYILPQHPERLDMVMRGTTASTINGITPEILADAESFPDHYEEIYDHFNGAIWVAYNIGFDARMLEQDCVRHGLVPPANVGLVDAMDIFAEFNGEWSPVYKKCVNKKLGEACALMGIELMDAHTAVADAVAMVALIERMADAA